MHSLYRLRCLCAVRAWDLSNYNYILYVVLQYQTRATFQHICIRSVFRVSNRIEVCTRVFLISRHGGGKGRRCECPCQVSADGQRANALWCCAKGSSSVAAASFLRSRFLSSFRRGWLLAILNLIIFDVVEETAMKVVDVLRPAVEGRLADIKVCPVTWPGVDSRGCSCGNVSDCVCTK